MAVFGPTDKLRCFSCHNLTGIPNLHVTPEGHLICSNCEKNRQILWGLGGTVLVLGPESKGRREATLREGAPADENGTEGTGHDPSRQPAGRLVSEPE
jgi:hypothetical protein